MSSVGRLIEIGRIVNLHGVRGELRLLPHNPETPALDGLPEVTLAAPNGKTEQRRVLSARHHKRFILLVLEGIETAKDAQARVGWTLSMRGEDLPPLAENQFYHHELIGCRVRVVDGTDLGTVREVMTSPSNDTLVIDGEHEYLIPLIAEVIETIDVEGGEIVVRPLPGLLHP